MRKVIFLIHMSLDGLVSKPNGEIDWAIYNEDMEKYSHELHNTTDTAIYGRVTYGWMEQYWPAVLNDPKATPSELNHAKWLENATKIVISRSMTSLQWNKSEKNTLLIRDNVAEEMMKIKQQPGKDLWLIGSPHLAQTFMQLGLIDEYRINVNPLVLGKGVPLFSDFPLQLKLIDSQTFPGGVVALRYEPTSK